MGGVALAFLWVAVVAYLALLLMLVGRIVRFPMHVAEDLTSPRRGPAFLALVAATCVLGSELAPINLPVSTAVWALAAVLWLGLSYAFLPASRRTSASRNSRSD